MTLHHISDVPSFLREVYLHLKERGVVIIGDLVKEDGSFHSGEKVPHEGFEVSSLERAFLLAGFTEVQTESLTFFNKQGRLYEIFFLSARKNSKG